jgi:rod shape-determining protein MreC
VERINASTQKHINSITVNYMMKKKVFVFVLLILVCFFFLFSKKRGSTLEEGLTTILYLPVKILTKLPKGPQEVPPQGKEKFLFEMEEENKRLRRLLDLKERSLYESLASSVIAREPSNWFHLIILDKGEKWGVKEGSIAITPEGLVGRVIKVNKNSSQVLLITDPGSEIGALVQRSRIQGVIQGRGRYLILKYLPLEADVREGDLILTSGLEGGLFPKGLTIGRVKKIETPHPQDLFLKIVVTPEANLSSLEEILVLKAK